MNRSTPLVLVLTLAFALLLAGCGGEAAENGGTIPGAGAVTLPEEEQQQQPGVASPGPFQSTEFEPPIAFNVPGGWRVQEEFGVVQAYRGEGDAQVLTFESGGEGTPGDRIDQISGTPDVQAEERQEVTVAGYDAVRVDLEPDYGMVLEGTEYYSLGQGPLRVWALDVDGTLVTIFAESTILRTERREAEEVQADFFNEVDQILASLEFGAQAGNG